MAEESGHAEDIYEGQTQERFWDNASQVVFANIKRTFDEYQGVGLDQQRALNQITIQALQNAVETANMVAKQAVKHTSDIDAQKMRHADIAIENQWESGAEVSSDAILAALAAAVAEKLK